MTTIHLGLPHKHTNLESALLKSSYPYSPPQSRTLWSQKIVKILYFQNLALPKLSYLVLSLLPSPPPIVNITAIPEVGEKRKKKLFIVWCQSKRKKIKIINTAFSRGFYASSLKKKKSPNTYTENKKSFSSTLC